MLKIGIVSNSEAFFPLAHALVSRGLQVHVFLSKSADPFFEEQANAFKKSFPMILFEHETDHTTDLYQWLNKHQPDLCFIHGYRHLVKINQLKKCKTVLYNIHYGALPAYRGPMPVFWQLKHGVEKLEMVIHLLAEKFDTGAVVWHKTINNNEYLNYQLANILFNQHSVEGALYIVHCFSQKISPPVIAPTNTKAAYHSRPAANDVLINWNTMNAMQILDLVKACNPWNKGAMTYFGQKMIKIMDAEIAENGSAATGLSINQNDKLLYGGCADNSVIKINMILIDDMFLAGRHLKNLVS